MNIMRGMLLATALLAAACGGEQSVASKSAAAYREAQAKGTPVGGGGHDHSAHGAASTTGAVDHSAHGATSTAAAAIDHSAHAGMNHGAATDHSGHAATGSVDHAAMGHGSAANAHAGHGATTRSGAVDHAAMGHGTAANAHAAHTATTAGAVKHDQHAGMQHGTASPAADPHAQHRAQTPAAQTDHSQHGTAPTPAATNAHAHAQHGTTAAPATASAPRSSTEIQRVHPAATLQRDAFDAPAAVSVSEAAKAAQGGGHEGHQTRGITPGTDRENPPTPMPATRDGSTTSAPAAATVYICPMHPEVTSDKPGTCPKCGMALVKKQ